VARPATCSYDRFVSPRALIVLALTLSVGLFATSQALGDDVSPGSPPTAVNDNWTLVPTLQAEIPVLANDSDADGDGLRIVSHTDPAYGSVTCSETTCTYVPPVRSLPGDDSDAVLAPEKDDSFTYTVADTTDRSAPATVKLTPIVPSKKDRKVHPGSKRCAATKSRRHAKSKSGGGNGIEIEAPMSRVKGTRCKSAARHHSKPKQQPSKPPASPMVNAPAITYARHLASAAAAPYVSGLRWSCSFNGTGSQGIGEFSIRSWIGENGSTGVNRLTLGYRVQIYGTNFYGQPSWVTVNVNKIAANLSYADSWNTWLPGNKDFAWLHVPWGNANYAVQHGPFRLQIRAQWLHRRLQGDKLIKQDGWGTPRNCQGQPEP
jgi:hypothetical protein